VYIEDKIKAVFIARNYLLPRRSGFFCPGNLLFSKRLI
jgi:hypothetical protein